MVRELVINAWCDLCAAEGVRTPGVSVQASLAWGEHSVGVTEVEVCSEHGAALLEPLLQALQVHGRSPHQDAVPAAGAAAKSAPKAGQKSNTTAPEGADRGGQYRCPSCGAGAPGFHALRQHHSNHHGAPISSMYGLQCPLCAAETEGARNLGVHIARQHDRLDMVQAFVTARHQGDPHGVVAKVEAGWPKLRKAS